MKRHLPMESCSRFPQALGRKWQEERFGKVVLEGAPLRDYVLWSVALPAGPRREWERQVAALRPGPALPERIRAVRVPGLSEGVLAKGVNLLLLRTD